VARERNHRVGVLAGVGGEQGPVVRSDRDRDWLRAEVVAALHRDLVHQLAGPRVDRCDEVAARDRHVQRPAVAAEREPLGMGVAIAQCAADADRRRYLCGGDVDRRHDPGVLAADPRSLPVGRDRGRADRAKAQPLLHRWRGTRDGALGDSAIEGEHERNCYRDAVHGMKTTGAEHRGAWRGFDVECRGRR